MITYTLGSFVIPYTSSKGWTRWGALRLFDLSSYIRIEESVRSLVMLTITLIALVLAIPLSSTFVPNHLGDNTVRKATISATLYTRIVAIALLFAAVLSYNCFSTMSLDALDAGVGLYSGLIHATTVTQSMEVFLLVSGALVLLP